MVRSPPAAVTPPAGPALRQPRKMETAEEGTAPALTPGPGPAPARRELCPRCRRRWEGVPGPGGRWAGRGLFTPGRAPRTGAAGARDSRPASVGPAGPGPGAGPGGAAARCGAPYITAAAETGRCAARGGAGAGGDTPARTGTRPGRPGGGASPEPAAGRVLLRPGL